MRVGLLAVIAVLLAVPASAAAASCTAVSSVVSYSGTASMSYSFSASAPDSGGSGTTTVSMDHEASDLTLSAMTPDKADQDFTGTATGGNVTVDDKYTDTGPPISTGERKANGPAQGSSENDNDTAEVSFVPSSCTYEVTVNYSIPTTFTGNNSSLRADSLVEDSASSQFSLPYTSLNLSGSESIAAYPGSGGDTLAEVNAGEYIIGSPFSGWSLALEGANGGSGMAGPLPAGTATFTWNLTPTLKGCTVPVLAGLTQGAATTALTKANCALGTVTTEPSSTVAKGDVISSDPAAGSVEPGGTKVALTISSGPNCTVPTLAGDTVAAARSALSAAHCATGTVTNVTSSTVAKGKVISSSPAAASVEASGTKVALTVSSGKKAAPAVKCKVPAVKKKTEAAAKTALSKGHCGVGKVSKKTSSTVAKGKVISSSPGAGSSHVKGFKVKLTVSSGKKASAVKCKVPVVKGKTEAAAKTALKKANCGVGAVSTKTSSTVAKGKVISSKPAAGTTHPKGTKVALTVSSGPNYKVPKP
jgi:beta-lactam-binding protein with PASTA domain